MVALLLSTLISMTGVWNAWGYNSGRWAELAPLLSERGYDTVFYCAAYGPKTDISGLQECVHYCHECGIDVNAWVVMWKTGKLSDTEKDSLAEQGKLQIALDGTTQPWLCPTDPENVATMAEVCMQIATSCDIRGIHLDYIRYSNNRVCYCDGCRKRFHEERPANSANWPQDFAPGGSMFPTYNRWRAQAITTAVAAVRDSLDKLDSALELSAAVLPREREMGYFAQPWDTWLAHGIIDFVVPMNYTLSDSELVLWGGSQLRMAKDHRIPCGLITFKNDHLLTRSELEHQQNLAVDMGFDGWVIFHLSDYFIELLETFPEQ